MFSERPTWAGPTSRKHEAVERHANDNSHEIHDICLQCFMSHLRLHIPYRAPGVLPARAVRFSTVVLPRVHCTCLVPTGRGETASILVFALYFVAVAAIFGTWPGFPSRNHSQSFLEKAWVTISSSHRNRGGTRVDESLGRAWTWACS